MNSQVVSLITTIHPSYDSGTFPTLKKIPKRTLPTTDQLRYDLNVKFSNISQAPQSINPRQYRLHR